MKIYYKDKRNKEVLEYVDILVCTRCRLIVPKFSREREAGYYAYIVKYTNSDELDEDELKDFMSLLQKAAACYVHRVKCTNSDELKDFMSLIQKVTDYYEHRVKCTNSDELNDFMFLLQKVADYYVYRVKCTNSDELKDDELNDFMFLLQKATDYYVHRVKCTNSDELKYDELNGFIFLLKKVVGHYVYRVKCTNSDELKYKKLNNFVFLLKKADGSFTYRHPDLVEYTEDEIHSKELKPGCVVECIKPESELYGEKLVVEDVEGLTIIVKTDEGGRKEIDIFSIRVV